MNQRIGQKPCGCAVSPQPCGHEIDPRERRYIRRLYGRYMMAALSFVKAEMPEATIWMVGSALHSPTRPRDVDIRIVLADDVFCARFGCSDPHEFWWAPQFAEWPRSEAWWAYTDYVQRVERFFSYAGGERNTDLSIVPECIFAHHADDPKERLAP